MYLSVPYWIDHALLPHVRNVTAQMAIRRASLVFGVQNIHRKRTRERRAAAAASP